MVKDFYKDYRLIIGMLVTIILSFITVYLFNMENLVSLILSTAGNDLLRAVSYMLMANFTFDLNSILTGSETLFGFVIPHVVMWLFLGFICGAIVKGKKRGATAMIGVIIVDILLWILLSVITSIDLMSFFTGNQLIQTLSAILNAFVCGVFGGFIGALVSGPYEGI